MKPKKYIDVFKQNKYFHSFEYSIENMAHYIASQHPSTFLTLCDQYDGLVMLTTVGSFLDKVVDNKDLLPQLQALIIPLQLGKKEIKDIPTFDKLERWEKMFNEKGQD